MKLLLRLFAAGEGACAAALAAGAMLLPGSAAADDRTSGALPEARLEIDDPSTGVRWLLVRDEGHPGGPGRLIRVEPDRADLRSPSHDEVLVTRPAIRTGDRLRLEEHTGVVDAVLEAVALASARPGALLKVRLKIGGRVVRAIAVAPGRAVLASGMGERP